MSNSETLRLLDEVMEAQRECEAAAATLTDEQLDRKVTLRSNREVTIRMVLYMLVGHPREHSVHLKKLLQETGAQGARPSEAQLILEQGSQSLGAFAGAFSRMTDIDLEREFEGETPRTILEHVKSSYSFYLQHLRGTAEA